MPEFHGIAALFPLMDEAALSELAGDIRKNGLREPIWLHNGKIIDGRDRYLACERVGVEPQYREWGGQGSLTAFVVSLNLKRRHMSTSQRAMVAAKLAKLNNGKRPSQDCEAATSRTDAAETLYVSPRLVDTAHAVHDLADQSVVDAVMKGVLSIGAAGVLSSAPKDMQRKALEILSPIPGPDAAADADAIRSPASPLNRVD